MIDRREYMAIDAMLAKIPRWLQPESSNVRSMTMYR